MHAIGTSCRRGWLEHTTIDASVLGVQECNHNEDVNSAQLVIAATVELSADRQSNRSSDV